MPGVSGPTLPSHSTRIPSVQIESDAADPVATSSFLAAPVTSSAADTIAAAPFLSAPVLPSQSAQVASLTIRTVPFLNAPTLPVPSPTIDYWPLLSFPLRADRTLPIRVTPIVAGRLLPLRSHRLGTLTLVSARGRADPFPSFAAGPCPWSSGPFRAVTICSFAAGPHRSFRSHAISAPSRSDTASPFRSSPRRSSPRRAITACPVHAVPFAAVTCGSAQRRSYACLSRPVHSGRVRAAPFLTATAGCLRSRPHHAVRRLPITSLPNRDAQCPSRPSLPIPSYSFQTATRLSPPELPFRSSSFLDIQVNASPRVCLPILSGPFAAKTIQRLPILDAPVHVCRFLHCRSVLVAYAPCCSITGRYCRSVDLDSPHVNSRTSRAYLFRVEAVPSLPLRSSSIRVLRIAAVPLQHCLSLTIRS